MLAWRGWKNQRRQLGFHMSGRGESRQQDERGLRLPEEISGTRPGSGRLGMEADEGQELITFPTDIPARLGNTGTSSSGLVQSSSFS